MDIKNSARFTSLAFGFTLAAATIAITEDQGITRCASNDCLLCRDSIAGGPIETPRLSA